MVENSIRVLTMPESSAPRRNHSPERLDDSQHHRQMIFHHVHQRCPVQIPCNSRHTKANSMSQLSVVPIICLSITMFRFYSAKLRFFNHICPHRDIFLTFYRSFFTRNPFFCAKTFSLRNKSDFFLSFSPLFKKNNRNFVGKSKY